MQYAIIAPRMSKTAEFLRKNGYVLMVPLWTGLLLIPFTGMIQALELAAGLGLAVYIWSFAGRDAVSAALKSCSGRMDSIRSSGDAFSRFLGTPVAAGAAFCASLVVPLFLNEYQCDILTLTCMYAVLALGLNLVVGQVGLLNLGYVAFYAVGAYTYAILSTRFGITFWPGILIGAAASALFSLAVGLPTLKLRGDYFAIVTLGLGEITRIVLNNWDSMTGGPNGIANIARPSVLGRVLSTPRDFYYLILMFAVLTVVAMRRLIASRIGRAWIAIREDETAAEAMGINTFLLKLLASVLAAAWAGAVGVFFAAKMAFVSPESFNFGESVMILCMVVLGGMGSIPGIVLGAFLLITLPEFLRDIQDYRMLAFGAALVLMMIFRPQGILGRARGKVA